LAENFIRNVFAADELVAQIESPAFVVGLIYVATVFRTIEKSVRNFSAHEGFLSGFLSTAVSYVPCLKLLLAVTQFESR
jgi:hypothetical protein